MNPEIHCQGYQTACLEGKQKQRQRNYKERILREKRTDTERERKYSTKHQLLLLWFPNSTTKKKPIVPKPSNGCAIGKVEGKCSAGAGEVLLTSN